MGRTRTRTVKKKEHRKNKKPFSKMKKGFSKKNKGKIKNIPTKCVRFEKNTSKCATREILKDKNNTCNR